jgi:hypothetical protein
MINVKPIKGGVVLHDPSGRDPKTVLKHGMIQWNKQRFARVARDIYGFAPNVEKKDDLIRMGQKLFEHSYKHSQNDVEAAQHLDEWTRKQDPDFLDFTELEQNRNVMFMTARWADQAFPVVTLGEKFCAALIATHIPADMLDEVEAPWHAFTIEVPGKLLSLFDSEMMQRTRVVRILVHRRVREDGVREWCWIGLGERGQHIWRSGTAREIIQPVEFRKQERDLYEEGDVAFEDDVHRDERLYVLVSRLVLNVCLAVSEPEMVRPVGASHKRTGTGRHGPPEQRVFQVGRPISLDCRSAIREYVEGERSVREMTVQSLIRGHWKRQPYGPKLSLRRRQWIEPYWRGPEDAPIAVRPHVFADEGGSRVTTSSSALNEFDSATLSRT